ncbi:MAG: ORF6N domain-containing protein [Bacteroidota bacterium]|nr:ORF6N domain-containing protein [Bacteroidota bacterium]
MKAKENELIVPSEVIMNKIYFIRGQKVMLDSDIAELYQVETKRLKEQVKRNRSRFPEKYMFVLTEKEFECLRSQIATSNEGRGGTRYLPMVFTEHGVLQLSNVLKSERAEKVSFIIIDVFVKLREMLWDNTDLRLIIEEIKKKTDNNTKNIELVFQYLDELLQKNENPVQREQIGYKIPKKQK